MAAHLQKAPVELDSLPRNTVALRTVLRDSFSSRLIALIGFFSMKNARRIFAIVSTTSIPNAAPCFHQGLCGPNRQWGPVWTPITPLTGALLHAENTA